MIIISTASTQTELDNPPVAVKVKITKALKEKIINARNAIKDNNWFNVDFMDESIEWYKEASKDKADSAIDIGEDIDLELAKVQCSSFLIYENYFRIIGVPQFVSHNENHESNDISFEQLEADKSIKLGRFFLSATTTRFIKCLK
jgi:hypothetical protein